MAIYRLVYQSKAIMDFDRYALHTLLNISRHNNAENHITGILLYKDGHFIQALEGEKDRVLALYQDIQNDSRHIEVRAVMQGGVSERLFPDWSMGFKELTKEEYKNIPGLNMFLAENDASLDETMPDVYRLLVQFKNDSTGFS